MATILSLPAVARLLERYVRQSRPATRDELLRWTDFVEVPRDRAEAGLRLAVVGNRLVENTGDDGATYHAPEHLAAVCSSARGSEGAQPAGDTGVAPAGDSAHHPNSPGTHPGR